MRTWCLLAALATPLAAHAQPSQAIRLEMRLARPQIAQGAIVPMTVRIVPVSAAAREVLGRRGLQPVRLVVTRSGHTLDDVAPTSLSSDLDRLRKLRSRPAQGGAIELDTDLAYWAVLDRPGRYDVVIEFAPGAVGATGPDAADAGFPPSRSTGMPLTVAARPAAELGRAVTDLIRRLAGQTGAARVDTVRALGALRSPAALATLVDELYGTEDSRSWAPAALGLLPDRPATVHAVRRALASRGISGPVTEVLLRAGDPAEGLVAAARAALSASAPAERRRGIEALAILTRLAAPAGQGQLVDLLVPLASDPDPLVRVSVLYGLERAADGRVLAALAAAGRDRVATVRAIAVHGLRERRAIPELMSLLGAAGTDLVEVSRALASLHDESAHRALVAALSGRALPLRLASARALWEAGDRAGKGVLLAVLRSRDDTARAEVIDWLTVVSGRSEVSANLQELSIAWSRWLRELP